MDRSKKLPAAVALATVGLIALVALLGCGGDESVASKSAAAYREAQKRGETFGGTGHAHGHGAMAPGSEHAGMVPQDGATGEAHPAGHDHGVVGNGSSVDHSAMEHGSMEHTGMQHSGTEHGSMTPGSMEHGGMEHMDHGQSPASGEAAGHAGHGASASQAPSAATQPPGAGHSSGTPSTRAPVAALPTQPAGILRPDALDLPAATSVLDAQRSEEMNREMSGGAGEDGGHGDHGGHGAGTYRQIDAGRGPGAYEGSEPQTPRADPHQGHGPAGPEAGHSHEPAPGEAQEAGLYVCPMHPEVTSKTPGTCPKCGMTLVKRREE